MGNCKDCKYYEMGEDGKPGICLKLRVADIWNGFDRLKEDGIGYSDEYWENESADLYVGDNFGCKHFKDSNNRTNNKS